MKIKLVAAGFLLAVHVSAMAAQDWSKLCASVTEDAMLVVKGSVSLSRWQEIVVEEDARQDRAEKPSKELIKVRAAITDVVIKAAYTYKGLPADLARTVTFMDCTNRFRNIQF